MSRRGFSIIEIVVAVSVLAVSLVALLTFSNQQVEGIEFTEDRLTAMQALRELQECFGSLPLYYYRDRGFPERLEDFSSLHASLLGDHPLMTAEPSPTTSDPIAAEIGKNRQSIGLKRAVLLRVFSTPAGVDAGLVRFVVRYKGQIEGAPDRELSSAIIVY